MRSWLVALLFVATLLAGCAGKAPSKPPEVVPQAFEDVKVTESTGAIRGIVVSEAVVPIANVTVKLTALGTAKTTDAQGAFVFTDLEGGDYFISASKPGYFSVQASATVVPGVADPPVVKVQLKIDASTQPFTELLTWNGFLECGFMWSSNVVPPPGSYAGANACGVTDGRFINTFPFGGGRIPDFAQAEAVWQGTQPLSNDLTLGYYLSGTVDWKFIYGQSPLTLTTNKTEIIDKFDENQTSLRMRMFPGQADQPASLVVTTNQAFDVYLTYFYGFTPRADWRFVNDGRCDSPQQCGA